MTTVLEYIENTPKGSLPQKITVKRTQTSKYLFYLLVRHYRIELQRPVQFVGYSKQEMQAVKGLLEEISVFGGGDLYVLEGFPNSFVSDLKLPKGVFVVAEVDDGLLEAPSYGYRQKRGILKVLSSQLGLAFSLRSLLGLDWTGCRDYPDVEVVLRKAKAAGWSLDDLSGELIGSHLGNMLYLLKKGSYLELLAISERYGEGWLIRHLVRLTSQMAVFKSLVNMRQNPAAVAEEMDLSSYRMKELEEASKSITLEDLQTLANRIIQLDRLSVRNPALATALLIFRSGISVRR